MLSNSITTRQLTNKILIDTTLPNIGDRWKELLLPVHNDCMEREQVKNAIKQSFQKKWAYQQEFEEIKEKMLQ